MRILVVFTGGTIGCPAPDLNNSQGYDNLTISADKTYQDYFLITEFLRASSRNDIVFDTIEPLLTLSENMDTAKWNILISALKNIDYSLYDGIIITHGTDTLSYTSSLISLFTSDIKIPVIFVSSGLSLDNPSTNGHKNFADAVAFILLGKYYGSYVFYPDNSTETQVYLSSRVKQCAHFIHRFDSIGRVNYGMMTDGVFALITDTANPNLLISNFNENKKLLGDFNLFSKFDISAYCLNNNVLIIIPYPGLDYSLIKPDPSKIKAVLHATYHSSTAYADTDKNPYSLLYFQNICRDTNIPLYLAPFYNNKVNYSSTAKLLSNGISTIVDVSFESAYAKLIIAYNLFDSPALRDSFLNSNINFEKI